MAFPPGEVRVNPLRITVRFTTSIPDLALDVSQPSKTTVITLIHLIRTNLSPPTSSRRLRLIYSGKILPDTAFLSSVVRVPPPPPRAPPDPKGKGKGKAIDIELAPTRVYINCSIGDVLTPEELAAETTAAEIVSPSLESDTLSTDTTNQNSTSAKTTTPAPRGFDRLLTTGFTTAEVSQLRLQFRTIQASMHTPDTMPSPTTLRRMEDAWIDDNGAAGGGNTSGADVSGGALDDLIWGLIIGFLWPLGAIGWMSREEGIWSSRKQMAVWSGFLMCLSFGMMNILAS